MEEISFNPKMTKALLIWIAVTLASAVLFPPFGETDAISGIALKYFALAALSAILASVGLVAMTSMKCGKILRTAVGLGFGWVGGLFLGMIYAGSTTPIGEASAWRLMTTIPCVFFCGVGGAISALLTDR
jgi:hypothetical protein